MARIVRAPVLDLERGERTLVAEVSHYLCRVLRLKNGDSFIAFDPVASMEAEAVIVEASESEAVVRIETPYRAPVVATTPLVLVYALAKGDKVETVVRDATELGATNVIIATTERCVVKVKPNDGKIDRWRRVAEQAARQCKRADPPAIAGPFPWTEALDRARPCEARFCLDPKAPDPLGPALRAALGKSIAFAIGPEGGLTDAELDEACARGFARVALGRIILRTETVAAAVLGAVRILAEP